MSIIAAAKIAFIKYILQKHNIDTRGGGLLLDLFVKDYKQHALPYREIHKIHKCGFSVEAWQSFGLNKDNCKSYLSPAQYIPLHPINGKFSHWIDDKLTLKYMCAGSKADFMPEYYFQIDECGKLYPLSDCPQEYRNIGLSGILSCLHDKKELAIKLEDSTYGIGFYKAEYRDGEIFLNKELVSEEKFLEIMASLRGYLITEYLKPHKDLAKIWPHTTNSIRYLVGKTDEGLTLITSFIRFGTNSSGSIDNYKAGAMMSYIDENGFFNGACCSQVGMNEDKLYECHPDSGVEIKGRVPCWDKIKECAEIFSETFPQLRYMGFDFVVTDKNEVKIMEVNSLSGIISMEHQGSVFDTPGGEFFKMLLNEKKS